MEPGRGLTGRGLRLGSETERLFEGREGAGLLGEALACGLGEGALLAAGALAIRLLELEAVHAQALVGLVEAVREGDLDGVAGGTAQRLQVAKLEGWDLVRVGVVWPVG